MSNLPSSIDQFRTPAGVNMDSIMDNFAAAGDENASRSGVGYMKFNGNDGKFTYGRSNTVFDDFAQKFVVPFSTITSGW